MTVVDTCFSHKDVVACVFHKKTELVIFWLTTKNNYSWTDQTPVPSRGQPVPSPGGLHLFLLRRQFSGPKFDSDSGLVGGLSIARSNRFRAPSLRHKIGISGVWAGYLGKFSFRSGRVCLQGLLAGTGMFQNCPWKFETLSHLGKLANRQDLKVHDFSQQQKLRGLQP